MANFEAYQEYQRIEDFEEDSPPGEEDLLVHVPEGLKGDHVTDPRGYCTRERGHTVSRGQDTVLLLFNVVFVLQTHGITSRTWTTSSQEYPLKQIRRVRPCFLKERSVNCP